jgi:Coenzyme PQQ synthesis protein D (PqqD)
MTSTTPWRHAEEISLVEGVDRVAIVTLTRLEDRPLVLTGTAASIWAAVDGARDDDAVASEVAARYDVPVEQIRTDVLTFLQHLASCQLISRT